MLSVRSSANTLATGKIQTKKIIPKTIDFIRKFTRELDIT